MKNNITINTQSSIKIIDNKIIYFDPFKIDNKSNDADLIFITHDHYDHFDINSIKNIMKDSTKIIIPKSIEEKVIAQGLDKEILITVESNNNYNILGYHVETIYSYNLNKPFHKLENGYLGYIITINDERIYIAGDTDVTEESKNVKCDIALIPIGGHFTMDYKEAADLINTIKPKLVIPTHYGSIIGSKKYGEKFKKLINRDIECLIIL